MRLQEWKRFLQGREEGKFSQQHARAVGKFARDHILCPMLCDAKAARKHYSESAGQPLDLPVALCNTFERRWKQIEMMIIAALRRIEEL